ncbi:MAG TPA: LacI family DNA-binding transcriptional regulator [Bacillaceae bacterium]|nr:LacI family DNA-binding transcriptional regulator [Bacillaceae bacterium]
MLKVTIKDVAKESGVSIATVSRVLNQVGFVSDEVRARVLATVERMNYQPNAVARSLKSDKTNIIGVIIPDISNPYYMTISKGIEDQIYQKGYNLIFCSSDESQEKERDLLQLLYGKRVDAIILSTSGGNEDLIKQIQKSGIPIILMDRKLDNMDTDFKIDIVKENSVRGAYELTKHVLELGHKKIGVVNGPMHISTGRDRYEGFVKAMKQYNLEIDTKYIVDGHFTQKGGEEAAKYFMTLPEMPSIIIAFNNSMSFGVLLELVKNGYQLSKDINLASYGELEAAQILRGTDIIYVRQNPYRIGETIGGIIIKKLVEGKRDTTEVFEFETELLVYN